MMKTISTFILAGMLLAAGVTTAYAWEDTPHLRIYYLSYSVDWNGKKISIAGRFQVPLDTTGKVPAVIMLHDTYGVSYRGVYYAVGLNRAGIATFEIDQWGGRGLSGGPSSRPKRFGDNLGDVGGAYRLLAQRIEIDAGRIGLMGSSMGGIETLLMMNRRNSDAVLGKDVHFRAAAVFYPICWLYNHVPGADFKDLVDAPVRIFVGSDDDYDGGPSACEGLVHGLSPRDAGHVSLRVFQGATHLFDTFEATSEYYDPASHRRRGGIVRVHPNSEARQQARDDLVQFFVTAFKER